MTTTPGRLNRRQALIGAGLVGVGGLAAALSGCGTGAQNAAAASPSSSARPSPTTSRQDSSSPLVGAWLDDITLGDGSKHQAVALYTADGGVASVPSLAASDFSTGFGAWAHSGSNFTITTERFEFDSSGQPVAILRIRILATVDQSGDQMTGHALLDEAAIGSSMYRAAGRGVSRSTRIRPMAP